MTISKEEIIDVIHSERLKRLDSIIEGQEQTIRTTKRYFWYMALILALTWLSGALIFVTGKFPPVEIPIVKPDFGSVYPDYYWSD